MNSSKQSSLYIYIVKVNGGEVVKIVVVTKRFCDTIIDKRKIILLVLVRLLAHEPL